MRTIAATLLLAALSTSALAWSTSPPWKAPQPTFNSGANLNTFGTPNFQTTTGTVGGQGVNLTTFGTQGFQTTTGTIGGQNVNCTSFGSGSFQTITCQ